MNAMGHGPSDEHRAGKRASYRLTFVRGRGKRTKTEDDHALHFEDMGGFLGRSLFPGLTACGKRDKESHAKEKVPFFHDDKP